MKRLFITFLLMVSLAHAKIELSVESSVVRKNNPVRIIAKSDGKAKLNIYDRFGKIVYSAEVHGIVKHSYTFSKNGIYIVVLKDSETNAIRKIILVVP